MSRRLLVAVGLAAGAASLAGCLVSCRQDPPMGTGTEGRMPSASRRRSWSFRRRAIAITSRASIPTGTASSRRDLDGSTSNASS